MICINDFRQVDQVRWLIALILSLFTFIGQATTHTDHPGLHPTMTYSSTLQNQLTSALAAKGEHYKPRTRHLKKGKAIYTNRLILQDSPYLLQHAHNPVNWYPWGKEAFAVAKKENKPIFLSIGYATCHWCHVMEEESFENIELSKALNKNFISIKVDREQYPDIDETYMTAVMVMTGNGGWPMSSFLMPDGRPFFGGTYYPPANFADLLSKVTTAWQTRHSELDEQAEKLSTAVKQATSSMKAVQDLGQSAISQAVKDILSRYDSRDGGFSGAPKFPSEPSLLLLLQIANTTLSEAELQPRLAHTLSAMAQGGLYDQVGGGFHRYSTDPQWLVPHFEKMLYNQAYLARIYTQAWQQTGDPLHARIARQTLDYILREMTHSSGGFYSATDADSEGEEGTYFVWTDDEINALLDQQDAEFTRTLYGVTPHGNFEGKNILNLPQSLSDIALQEKIDLTTLLKRVDKVNQQLRAYREKRIPPLTDDKIIVAWNSMLIVALAEAGEILEQQKYIHAANKAAEFLWQKQRPESGTLLRVNLSGKPSIPARQDDYAHFIEALIALYDVTNSAIWLQRAQNLCDEMLTKFWDNKHGAFLMGQDELLFAQPKDTYDNATPSGNSVAIRILNRLAKRTGHFNYAEKANETLKAFSGSINENPAAFAYMLAQLDEHLHGEKGSRQFAANGAIRITSRTQKSTHHDQLSIKLDIRDGWHINANKPLHTDLIPTSISLNVPEQGQITSVNYPEKTLKTLSFEEKPLALYSGEIEIKISFKSAETSTKALKHPIQLLLQIQACNEETCLPPESIRLWFFLPQILASDAE